MKLQTRYRSIVMAALAISFVAIGGFPQLASAASPNNGREEIAQERREAAPGQEKKADTSDSEPSEGTPTAADNPEGPTTHDGGNGPGGQVCDGDPTGKSDGGNGANGGGDNYNDTCPTTDQTVAAPNGAGDGKATGKPAEGSVGAADDKNPKGQFSSGPSDHNNGYECDEKGRSANEGNNGVGYGNPAHTGCEGTTTETCPDGSPMPANGDCDPDETCPDGSPMPANGDCDPDETCPDGSPMPGNGDCDPDETCPDGSPMPANGKCGETKTCPDGSAMPASGNCGDPCVPGASGNVCGQQTPSCVNAASENRCGGGNVAGETLGRPVEVLGVQINAPTDPQVASAGLARTGFGLLGVAQGAFLLAIAGGLLLVATKLRRREAFIDLSARLPE